MSPIERAARAVAEYMICGHCDGSCEDCTGEARVVFESIDVDELARVVGSVHKRETETYGQYDRRRARAVVAHLTKGDESDE